MASATHQPSEPALQRLRYELQNQRRHAGDPSYRDIALRTSKALSHTTVGSVLRCESVPNWGQLELVVDVLGGDVETFRVLWRAARDETAPLALPAPSPEWFPEETVRTPAAELTLSDLDEAEADLRNGTPTAVDARPTPAVSWSPPWTNERTSATGSAPCGNGSVANRAAPRNWNGRSPICGTPASATRARSSG